MLKNRLIPAIVIKGDLVVQSFGFRRYLPIGNVMVAIEFFMNWDVDEIAILDIDASREGRGPNLRMIEHAAQNCFLPLTVGGGIRSIEDIRSVLSSGADKVAINHHALEDPSIITRAADRFGVQCVVLSIDAAENGDGRYGVYSHIRRAIIDREPAAWAREVQALGAGEILLNSVDRDGSRQGYDLRLLREISGSVEIPVIALGGVGRVEHLSEGIIEGGCQAAAAGNIFHHTEHSTIAAKANMRNRGAYVRLSSKVKYEDFSFDSMGRPI